MKQEQIYNFIRSVEIFSLCKDENVRIIAENSQLVKIPAGGVVFSEVDEPEHFYAIVSGQVVIRRKNSDDEEMDLARFVQGDYFGEADVFHGESRNARALVDQEAELLIFPAQDISYTELSSQYPLLGAELLYRYILQVCDRIRKVNNMVKEKSPLVNELRHQVYVDKLTGLLNSTSFRENLARIIDTTQKSLAVIMFKPDNFKKINDTFGHETGDKLLVHIADLLSGVVPDRDMLFRYQGNENAIILPGAGRDEAKKQALLITQFFRRIKLDKVIPVSEQRLTASVGVALYPEHGEDMDSLLSIVSHLPLEGRKRGGDTVVFPEDVKDV